MKGLLMTAMVGAALCASACTRAGAEEKEPRAIESPPQGRMERIPGDPDRVRAADDERVVIAQKGAAKPAPEVVVIVSKGDPKTVEAIARARCEREQRCGNIGKGKDWTNQQACLNKVATDWSEELNALECPGGIRKTQLDACLSAIRAEECGAVFDKLERALACRKAEICAD